MKGLEGLGGLQVAQEDPHSQQVRQRPWLDGLPLLLRVRQFPDPCQDLLLRHVRIQRSPRKRGQGRQGLGLAQEDRIEQEGVGEIDGAKSLHGKGVGHLLVGLRNLVMILNGLPPKPEPGLLHGLLVFARFVQGDHPDGRLEDPRAGQARPFSARLLGVQCVAERLVDRPCQPCIRPSKIGQCPLDGVGRDLPLLDHIPNHVRQFFASCAQGEGDAPGMHGHVPSLNAFRSEGTDCGQVLGEPHGCGNPSQIRCALNLHDLQAGLGDPVYGHAASNDPDRHRKLEFARYKTAVLRLLEPPDRQRLVGSITAGESVGPGLDASPVVTRGKDDRVYPVHDSLVVGGGPVGVQFGEARGGHDAFGHSFGGKVFRDKGVHRNAHASRHTTPICEVGKNAQSDLSSCDLLEGARHGLAGRVDEIRPHGVPAVEKKVHDHVTVRLVQDPKLDVPGASAPRLQARMDLVHLIDQVRLFTPQPRYRSRHIRDAPDLHLPDHPGVIAFCRDSSPFPRELGSV